MKTAKKADNIIKNLLARRASLLKQVDKIDAQIEAEKQQLLANEAKREIGRQMAAAKKELNAKNTAVERYFAQMAKERRLYTSKA